MGGCWGPHLLHDAIMAASYRPHDDSVASISRADSVAALREESGGPYRIFTPDEAIENIRGGRLLPLHPLCGGVAPEVAWPYLELAVAASRAGSRPRKGEAGCPLCLRPCAPSLHGPPGESARTRSSMRSGADRIWNSLGYGCILRTRSARTRASSPAASRWVWRPPTTPMRSSPWHPTAWCMPPVVPERDGAAVPDYLRLLQAGINVVSTSSTSLVYPPSYFVPDWRDQLEAAAKSGGVSFYVSGIFPGFASDQLALLADDPVKEHPQHHGQRGCAQRRLRGRRRDDGRDGFRPPAGLRTHAEDTGFHRNCLEGTDLPDGEKRARRAEVEEVRGIPRPSSSPIVTSAWHSARFRRVPAVPCVPGPPGW